MAENDLIPSSSLYKDRPEWKDVTPIYESKEESAAVSIKHDETFVDAFAYLRAMLQTGEKSERGLELTETCIQQNPANYTLWQYRRDCLLARGKDVKETLKEELRFLDDVILENPKNYQVWHHRRACVERIGEAGTEQSFTREVLTDESKNYHAWQHRQWVVRRFDLPAQPELDFAMKLILEDPRNNSAWNFRYFVLQRSGALSDPETLAVEINLSKKLIEKMPNNESVWNYLSGILMDPGLDSNADVVQFVREQYEKTEKDARSFHLLAFLVDVLNEKISRGEAVVENAEEAKKFLDELIQLDTVRANYWTYQKLVVESALQKVLFASM